MFSPFCVTTEEREGVCILFWHWRARRVWHGWINNGLRYNYTMLPNILTFPKCLPQITPEYMMMPCPKGTKIPMNTKNSNDIG